MVADDAGPGQGGNGISKECACCFALTSGVEFERFHPPPSPPSHRDCRRDRVRPPELALMPIDLRCPGCQRVLVLPDETVGRRVRCPACRAEFESPACAAEFAIAGPGAEKNTDAPPAVVRVSLLLPEDMP